MFKKLLSNLPFNPSLIHQVTFYTKRIKKEKSIRKLGFVFMTLTMFIQMFAILFPPQPTLAESSNDIIRGGFATKEQAVLHCLNGSIDFFKILDYYGVGCDTLNSATTINIKSTDYNNRLDSLGRNPQPANNPKNGKPSDQYTVNIPGVSQLYMKNLWYWDTYSSSSYKVLSMKNKHGQTIFILYSCANIVTIDKYSPPAPTPSPTPAPTPTPEPTPEKPDLCPKIIGKQYTKEECDVCPNIPGEQSSANECYPCPEAKTNTAKIACLSFDKTASNLTQKIENTNKKQVKSGDEIRYTLKVTNKGSTDFVGFVFTEELNDVLEYSDIVTLNGGTIDITNKVTWPKIDIKAGSSIEKQFVIKVKNPIPNTIGSSSDPGSFDLIMTNVFYDKSISIFLPKTPVKIIEQTSKELPNTGPGENIAIGLLTIIIIGYYFARSKLYSTELTIVRDEFAKAGDL